MERSPITYARSGDTHVAYQTIGEGPDDIVFVWGGISHLEAAWEHRATAAFFEQLATGARLILLDKRGTGLSDRVPFSSALDARMDDVRAVLDAAGSEQAVVFGESEAAGIAALFATTFPERVDRLILYAPLVRTIADDDFPWAHTAEEFQRYIDASVRHWGDGLMMSLHSPSTIDDAAQRAYWGRLERLSMSPGGFVDHMRTIAELDIRPILPLVQAPTLVIHRTDDPTVPVGQGRLVADLVQNGTFLELPGHDHYPMVGDAHSVLRASLEFISHEHMLTIDVDRILTTVLFTDIVGSTETLAAVGDHRWHRLIDLHDDIATTAIAEHRGKAVRSTGDGVLATFDGPARAIRCAEAIRAGANRLGLQIRAGLHSGEVEMRGDDITGIAVHTAARVQSVAHADELLVSRTVVDLVAGSGLQFDDRGVHELKGVPGEWHLFRVGA